MLYRWQVERLDKLDLLSVMRGRDSNPVQNLLSATAVVQWWTQLHRASIRIWKLLLEPLSYRYDAFGSMDTSVIWSLFLGIAQNRFLHGKAFGHAKFFFMDCMEKGYQGLCSKSTTIETLILWPTNKLFLQYGSSCLKIETWATTSIPSILKFV